ncbi:MAG: ABC transporter permease [Phycisphaerae bacterium]|nr:ABC transporter permease [Phycisphaerae bacterium]
MIAPRFIPLVLKQVWRARIRSVMTITGVTIAMFLFAAVQAMQAGVEEATQQQAGDTTLVVYRKDRYCPFSSRLPQSYEQQIQRIPGVKAVVPIRIVVSNCRTSLDVVTFRGVPDDAFLDAFVPNFEFVGGSAGDWRRRSDAALIGETLATRRGLRVGDQFEAAGITVYVAGVIRSPQPQDQNVAYVHLDFLQYASGSRSGGIVTQFNVQVTDADRLDEVAAAIDGQFAPAQEPTNTSPEKAFVARAALDVIEIVGFMRWMGWGCLAAVLALVGNAVVLSVQDRIREHAIFQTLGFRGHQIASLIIAEGLVLSLSGALIGSATALAFLSRAGLAFSVDANSIAVRPSAGVFVWGLVIAATVGVVAGLVPAWQAARREIVTCFRAV